MLTFIRILIKDLINLQPNDEDNFIICGGTSLKAIEFLECLESQLKNRKINEDQIIEYILNRTFKDLVDFIINISNIMHKNDSKLESTKFTNEVMMNENKEIICLSKNERKTYEETVSLQTFEDADNIEIELKWKYDTKKCVDATVLYVSINCEERYLLIGSHSHQFACINANNGELKWLFNAKDRIESSACMSMCKNFVIFG